MGLDINGLVRDGINLAMALTPDVQKTVSYKRRRGSVYNAVTGAVTVNETVAAGIKAIITTYSEDEIDGEAIQLGDERVVMRFKDLMMQGISNADTDDVLEDSEGVLRQVVGFTLDPTKQVLTLQCRQIGS